MNKSSKPVIILAVLAAFGVANAQAPAAPAAPHAAPAATAPAAPAATVPAAPAATTPAAPAATAPAAPAATHAAPAATAPAAPAATHAAPAATAPAAPAATTPAAPAAPHAAPAATAPAAPAATPAPAAAAPTPAPVASTPAAEAPAPAPVAEAKSPKADSTIVIIVEEPKKKKRVSRAPKNEFAVVDVPANFEIQAKKTFPIADGDWSKDNLDTWWGRANLMVQTESENFVGKIHLRMYPGQFYGKDAISGRSNKDRYGNPELRDAFLLYEAWAWHRGDYVNIKIGRWENTTRFGSRTFGGYIDARKDNDTTGRGNYRLRESGFMSTYTPENAVQFGFNNFSENISLDIALISGDNHLNRGDLRVYFAFKDLAGLENVDIGLGYRSNVFDEIYSKRGDVTHTIDFGFRVPLVKDAGILKSLNLFGEAALIGLDDQIGEITYTPAGIVEEIREDRGGSPRECNPAFPLLGGLDFTFHRGVDKLVIEAEYDGKRKDTNPDVHVKSVLGSIYIQKKLNDRFTLNMGIQSENNTKDFSYAARLQGRIN